MTRNPAASGTGLIARLATVHEGRASRWRFLLIALWLAWAVLLFGGFLLDGAEAGATQRIPTWCRMSSSFALVVAAFTWLVATAGQKSQRYALLLALGMTLGFLGDLFNAGLLRFGLSDPTLGGIVAFGLGHVAYIGACVYAARMAMLNSTPARWGSLTAWWLVGVVCWYFVAYQGDKSTDLRWPGLGYTLLLAATTGLATSLALQSSRFLLLAVGAVLFLLSDLVLAYRLFHGDFRLGGDLTWLLYGPAQMMIVYSLATARTAMEHWQLSLATRGPTAA
jgi:hypothetical protein